MAYQNLGWDYKKEKKEKKEKEQKVRKGKERKMQMLVISICLVS